jgi:hypothetical protein
MAYNTLGGLYRLSVADAHAALGEERYATLAAEGGVTDWQRVATQSIDVLNALSAPLASEGD